MREGGTWSERGSEKSGEGSRDGSKVYVLGQLLELREGCGGDRG